MAAAGWKSAFQQLLRRAVSFPRNETWHVGAPGGHAAACLVPRRGAALARALAQKKGWFTSMLMFFLASHTLGLCPERVCTGGARARGAAPWRGGLDLT